MTKTSSGVYQLSNGTWGFRYAFWVDGKQKDIKRTNDENGKPFKTKSAAIQHLQNNIFSKPLTRWHNCDIIIPPSKRRAYYE